MLILEPERRHPFLGACVVHVCPLNIPQAQRVMATEHNCILFILDTIYA